MGATMAAILCCIAAARFVIRRRRELAAARADMPARTAPRKRQRKNPYDEALNEVEWRRVYQMQRLDIPRVVAALRLPEFIHDDSATGRHKEPSINVFMWLLYRYVGGRTLQDCDRHFGVDESKVGRLTAVLERMLVAVAKPVFNGMFNSMLTRNRLAAYAACITAAGCPIPGVWGFLDGCHWDV
jgi:hypothetical protein